MTTLPVVATERCWQHIGVWGNRSCPELMKATHCHNCPVFAAAGRRFLDAPTSPEYMAEWSTRLAAAGEQTTGDHLSVLVFRIGNEWLALPVVVLVEVTRTQTPHRITQRGELLAGLVNIRGELHLCVRLDLLLGITPNTGTQSPHQRRLVVIRQSSETWVFAADEVDQVHRFDCQCLTMPAPTLARAGRKLTRGVFDSSGRSIGLLDEERLFQTIRERLR